MSVQPNSNDALHARHDYLLDGITIPTLTDSLLARHSLGLVSAVGGYIDIQPQGIDVDQGAFTSASRIIYFPTNTQNLISLFGKSF